MALEAMRAALRARLDELGAQDPQKAAWLALWDEARARPGEPLPCPVCFVQLNQVSRLVALRHVGELARARCEVCRTEFEWPDD